MLGKWSAEEYWTVQGTREYAALCARSWLEEGTDKAATKWNKTYEELKKVLDLKLGPK